MKPLSADCSREFFPAIHSSGRRSFAEIFWIVMHDEEADNARGAARYFHEDPDSGGSTQLTVDGDECYRCLANDEIPWGAKSAPRLAANTHGFHIEQAGFAKWSAVIWKSHLDTLKRAAYKAAQHCVVCNLPTVFVPASVLVSGDRLGRPQKGITTHAEITKASKILDPTGSYDHTDPGPFWPRTLFMYLVRRYYAQITAV